MTDQDEQPPGPRDIETEIVYRGPEPSDYGDAAREPAVRDIETERVDKARNEEEWPSGSDDAG